MLGPHYTVTDLGASPFQGTAPNLMMPSKLISPVGSKGQRAFYFPTLSGQKYNAGGVGSRQYPGTTKLPAWVQALERELSDSAPVEIV